MAEKDKDHRPEACATKGNQAVERVMAVVEFLASGEMEEWRSVREVAEGIGLPVASCHGILEGLAAGSWADKREGKGYRIGAMHLLGMLVAMQKYYMAKLNQLGVDI